MKGVWGVCLALVLLLSSIAPAAAGELADRLASFPNWEHKLLVRKAQGDIVYPDWMAGTWEVTSTLVELVAPLAPAIVTPGFESNRRYLGQPVSFQVRFVPARSPVPALKLIPRKASAQTKIVADRAFNGLNLARAYLGERAVLAVKVDPNSPNRQITLLRGSRQLVSIVTGRATETPKPGEFVTAEVFQQLFRERGGVASFPQNSGGVSRPYFNQVESIAFYRRLSTPNSAVEAEQVTAISLSPQDPDYFAARSRPVALYRYQLEFLPLPSKSV